jgi:hypothetical protein
VPGTEYGELTRVAKAYNLEFWRLARTGALAGKSIIAGRPDSIELKDVPVDVPMDDTTLTFWNGEGFESIERWPAYTQLPIEPRPDPRATRLAATCGATPVELRRDGARWLMWAGVPLRRRKDFASPYLEHAQRTAVFWYGAPAKDWLALDIIARKPPGKARKSTTGEPSNEAYDDPLPEEDEPA